MSKTANNTHRRAMRPVTPAVRAGRVAAGAAMAAGMIFGGAVSATADPRADAAPQADSAPAGPVSAIAPAVGIPAIEAAEEDGDESAEATLAPAPGSISIALPEPEPEPAPQEEAEQSDGDSEENDQRTESRQDDGASRSEERTSRDDSGREGTGGGDSEGGNDEDSGESGSEQPQSAPSSAAKGGSVLATARSGIGTPYVFGGTSPSGWDCSGFVQWVYAQHGINLPRGAAGQAAAGTVIPRSEARPGDLVYKPGHIGIYAGGNNFVDAGNSRVDTSERNIYSGSWTFIRIG